MNKKIVLFYFLTSVIGVSLSSDEMCEPAVQKLIDSGVATAGIKSQLPNSGTPICDGGPCCIPSLGTKMESRGRNLIHSAMHTMATHLLERVTSVRDRFKESMEAAILSSETATLQSLAKTHPRMVGHAKESTKQLYAAFRAALTDPDDSMMDRALKVFWSELFPLVYHSAIHSNLQPFTHGYMECLRKAVSTHAMRPWKFVPEQIGDPLIKGLEVTRLMLHALNVGSDVILKARLYQVPAECGPPAARLYFCSSCHASLVPPCSGLCLNVNRGCLAPLAELDGPWNDLGNAVLMVKDSVRRAALPDILSELPEILSDAIMYAMESGYKLEKQVHAECGPHSFESSAEWEAKTREGLETRSEGSVMPAVSSPISHTTVVNSLAEEAAAIVGVGFWTKIADDACANMTTLDKHCWNGKNVAQYSRPAAGVGVSAQKYNPEVQVSRPDISVYALADELREVKRLVTKRHTWLPESDSFKRAKPDTLEEGSGDERSRQYQDNLQSQRPGYPAFDDEDGGYAGSGSGPLPGEEDYRGNRGYKPKHTDGMRKDVVGHGISTRPGFNLTMISLFLIFIYKEIVE